jgi:hypothetical protein
MTWRCREAGDGEEAQAAMASHRQDIFTADRGSESSKSVYISRVPSTGKKEKKANSSNAQQLSQIQQPSFQQVRSSRPRTKPAAGSTCSILHDGAVSSHMEKTFSPNYQLGDGTAPGSEVTTGGR